MICDGTDQDVYKRPLSPRLVVAVLIDRSITHISTDSQRPSGGKKCWPCPPGRLKRKRHRHSPRWQLPCYKCSGLAPPAASNVSAAVIRRDGSCRVTNAQDYVDRAHLCPRSQAALFEETGMGHCNLNLDLQGDYIVDDISNAVALRSDIHRAFDERKFLFVPKESRWVVHFFDLTNTLGQLYHNTALELDSDISPNLLFARFAWTVFPRVSQFLKVGVGRKLRLRVMKDDGLQEEVQTVKAQEMAVMGLVRGRNLNSKKRKNAESTETYTNRALNLKQDRSATNPSYSPSTPPPRAHALWFPDPNPKNSVSSCDKATWIKSRRPSSPDLYCCDYNKVEAAIREGLPGKEEFGGGHLCLECLGFEYRDTDDNKNCAGCMI